MERSDIIHHRGPHPPAFQSAGSPLFQSGLTRGTQARGESWRRISEARKETPMDSPVNIKQLLLLNFPLQAARSLSQELPFWVNSPALNRGARVLHDGMENPTLNISINRYERCSKTYRKGGQMGESNSRKNTYNDIHVIARQRAASACPNGPFRNDTPSFERPGISSEYASMLGNEISSIRAQTSEKIAGKQNCGQRAERFRIG
ncbi:hypothetical protein KM043_011539 [Ampulex compressa]|nr:hypothetical protein KM043_011539 [Ampulex compressa]